jgi:MFS transporter, ACS family, tartrate transporter
MQTAIAERTIGKLNRRIALVTLLLFVLSYLDRSNVSLVAIQMNRDLHFSGAVYGLGAGIFFLGYAIFEVPSNLILHRVGARVWIGRIMVTWGILASAMALVTNASEFYTIRFLIGVAEAGFQPGILYYLSQWYPRQQRARAFSIFNSAGPLSVVIGAPLTGALLALSNGALGVSGWRWIFALEGVPSVMLGIWTIFFLPENPRNADWLDPQERTALADLLSTERRAAEQERSYHTFEWLRDPRILAYAAFFFCMAGANWGVLFWLPQIVNGMGRLSSLEVGLLTALPYLCGLLVMRRVARFSDRFGSRRGVIAVCAFLAGLGFLGSTIFHSPVLWLICLCVSTAAIWSCYSPFWTMPSAVLTGAAAATGLAFINSVGQVGGLVAPYGIGVLKDATNSYQVALLGLAVACFVAGAIALLLRRNAPSPGGAVGDALISSGAPPA